jgi:hypothetical protein
LEIAATKTAAYVRELNAHDPTLEVGDIEPYPFERPAQLKQWVSALIRNGIKPAHFHLDVNIHYLDVHSDIDAATDLRSVSAFLLERGIPVGIILWSGYDPEPTDKDFFDRTMAWVRRVRAIGIPQHVIFQSWVLRSYKGCSDTNIRCAFPKLKCPPSDAIGCGLKSVPVNLPEGNPREFSLTRLVNEALSVLQMP